MYISIHQIQTKAHHCNRRLGSSTGEGENSTGEVGPWGHREVLKKSLLLSPLLSLLNAFYFRNIDTTKTSIDFYFSISIILPHLSSYLLLIKLQREKRTHLRPLFSFISIHKLVQWDDISIQWGNQRIVCWCIKYFIDYNSHEVSIPIAFSVYLSLSLSLSFSLSLSLSPSLSLTLSVSLSLSPSLSLSQLQTHTHT